MSFIADRVVMDGLTFDDVLLIPATFRATASKFSKVVICIRSFLQILYHSITAKVVAINILRELIALLEIGRAHV